MCADELRLHARAISYAYIALNIICLLLWSYIRTYIYIYICMYVTQLSVGRKRSMIIDHEAYIRGIPIMYDSI